MVAESSQLQLVAVKLLPSDRRVDQALVGPFLSNARILLILSVRGGKVKSTPARGGRGGRAMSQSTASPRRQEKQDRSFNIERNVFDGANLESSIADPDEAPGIPEQRQDGPVNDYFESDDERDEQEQIDEIVQGRVEHAVPRTRTYVQPARSAKNSIVPSLRKL